MDSTTIRKVQFVRFIGLSVFVAALLLSLPGVRAVRAGEPDMTPVGGEDFRGLEPSSRTPVEKSPPAGQATEACGDSTPREPANRVARIPLPPAQDGSAGMILLNNRGYNYGSATAPDDAQWQQIEREMRDRPPQ